MFFWRQQSLVLVRLQCQKVIISFSQRATLFRFFPPATYLLLCTPLTYFFLPLSLFRLYFSSPASPSLLPLALVSASYHLLARLTVCDWCREVALTLLTLLVHGGRGRWRDVHERLITLLLLADDFSKDGSPGIDNQCSFFLFTPPKLSPRLSSPPQFSKSETRSSCSNYEGKAHLHTEK